MTAYRFLSAWLIEAPADQVWDTIHDSERWPQWWKGVQSAVELEPGDALGVGSLARYRWRSRLPYTLEFDVRTTRAERPHLLEGRAQGELTGVGRWRFFQHGPLTAVIYEWNVSTSRGWMNALAPVARLVFAWNHDVVMRQGAEGLAHRLGARLVTCS